MKIKSAIKKMTLAAGVGLALASSGASLASSTLVHAATTRHFTATKYFPGENEHTDWDYPSSLDDEIEEGSPYWRNFKTKNANIYVKDKQILPVVKKAAKAWSPVFKFHFVKSGKHANFNSSKYANIVFRADDGRSKACAACNTNRVFRSPDAVVKSGEARYDSYAGGKITNAKKYLANARLAKIGSDKFIMPSHENASKVGMWIPSYADARKNSWEHVINIDIGTKGTSEKAQVGAATLLLGDAIGYETSPGLTNEGAARVKLTQRDYDYVDWIYAHPWAGPNTNSLWLFATLDD